VSDDANNPPGVSITNAVVLVAVTSMAVFLLTGTWVSERWRTDAVKAGKAEYYLDADNQRQWRWKP